MTLVGNNLTHTTESRYAKVVGEALAVADALDKARSFVLGCRDLIIAVDHKPLLKAFGDWSIEEVSNARLCNLKQKTLHYTFCTVNNPRMQHKATDAISRHPTGPADVMMIPDDVASISTLANLRSPSPSGPYLMTV